MKVILDQCNLSFPDLGYPLLIRNSTSKGKRPTGPCPFNSGLAKPDSRKSCQAHDNAHPNELDNFLSTASACSSSSKSILFLALPEVGQERCSGEAAGPGADTSGPTFSHRRTRPRGVGSGLVHRHYHHCRHGQGKTRRMGETL